MGKSKEEIRIEKIIRSLLKLPENRRCINCRSLGPQYVCTTFWTFICTNCSGVHREFNHRVKSISMAKFTSEEVDALQAAGNERTRQIYFKTWDAQRNIYPDNSNIHRLRDFIKNIYVDRRYTGETHPALIPRLENIDNEEPYDRRSGDATRKTSFPERALERYGQYSFKEVRSFGYQRDKSPRYGYGGFKSTSSRFDGTGGQYQVDGARIAGRSATDMFTTEDIKPSAKSPDSSSPPIHHVREISGENFPRLCVGDQPSPSERTNFTCSANNPQVGAHSRVSNRNVDSPSLGQEGQGQAQVHKSGDQWRNLHRSTSTSSQSVVQSTNQKSGDNADLKQKSGSAGSLVNFADFPPPEVCMEQQQRTDVGNNGGNSAPSQTSQVEETARNTPAKNALEYFLFELCSPIETPSNNHSQVSFIEKAKESSSPQQPWKHSIISVVDVVTPSSQQSQQHSIVPVLDVVTPSNRQPQQHSVVPLLDVVTPSSQQPRQHSVVPVLEGSSPSTQQHSVDSVLDCSISTLQTSWSNGVTDDQPETLFIVPSVAVPRQEKISAARVKTSTTEARSTERAELPAELFSSFNPRGPPSGWQMGPSHSMGFNLQYHPAFPQIPPAFPGVTKSRNPFDTNDNTTQHYATSTMFPSMTPVQGGLPNLSTSPGISHTSSFGSNPQGYVPSNSSPFASGTYMGQHLYSNMPATRHQGVGGYGGHEGGPGSLNSNQHSQYTYPIHTNMSSFPKGGQNPFG